MHNGPSVIESAHFPFNNQAYVVEVYDSGAVIVFDPQHTRCVEGTREDGTIVVSRWICGQPDDRIPRAAQRALDAGIKSTTTQRAEDASGRFGSRHISVMEDDECATRLAERLQGDCIPAVAYLGDEPHVIWWTYR